MSRRDELKEVTLVFDRDQSEDLEGLDELTGVPCLGVCGKPNLILARFQVRVVGSEECELHATRLANGGTSIDHVTSIDLAAQDNRSGFTPIRNRIDCDG